MLHLKKQSLNWALRHALAFGDTDVFPSQFEFQAIKKDWSDISKFLRNEDIHNWKTRPLRSLLSPKSRYGFRVITQLDPLDFLVFAALMYEIGNDLEAERVPVADNIVFSHRFRPDSEGRMYDRNIGYLAFQDQAKRMARASHSTHVAVTDIADFYPRIYSHRLENALSDCTKRKAHVTAIKKLLSGWNETESHGIPVGSAPSRLLAEITISDVDQALIAHGMTYIRYSDDYRIFCKSYSEAFRQLAILAQVLYDIHGLTLQPQKTSIYTVESFRRYFLSSPEDKELDELRERFATVLDELGLSDPYEQIDYDDLTDEQRELVDSLNLQGLFSEEIKKHDSDLSILRFVLRRLSQLGDNCLVEMVLANIEVLHPIFPEIIRYFQNLRYLRDGAKAVLAKELLALLKDSIISELPFFRMWTFSLFSQSNAWDNENQFQRLLSSSNDQFSRRELILAMARANHQHWFQSRWRHLFDETSWPRRALLAGASCLPTDARNHWYRSVSPRLDILEKAVVKWAKNNPLRGTERRSSLQQ
jgi:Reverse transcriptase (RNA-dependent DNA polymerase)